MALTPSRGNTFDAPPSLEFSGDWDLVVKYHSLKASGLPPTLIRRLRSQAVQLIVRRATQLRGSLHRETLKVTAVTTHIIEPSSEPDWEASLDASPVEWARLAESPEVWRDDLVLVSSVVTVEQPLTLIVDTSLSMTGEKLALLAIAVAAILLELKDSPVTLVAFENEARVLKRAMQVESLERVIGRLMDVPAQGYTHMERGLEEGLRLEQTLKVRGRQRRSRPVQALLLTDGKSTAGADPISIVHKFNKLSVIKLGSDRSSLELSTSIARRGGGTFKEIRRWEELPSALLEFGRNRL